MSSSDWAAYNESRADRAPRPLCLQVLDAAGPGAGRRAIDLGAGSGVEAGAMLAAGWRVVAIDGEPAAADLIWRFAPAGDQLQIRTATFDSLGDLPAADLVYAGYSLPYAGPAFDQVWTALRLALLPGGWLAVHLFGDRDSQRQEGGDERFVTRTEALDLLAGLELVSFDEEDAPGQAYGGPKHWHVFHVIARRPPARR